MIKIENEQVYMFDVDDTLVMWNGDCKKPSDNKVAISDPYDGIEVFLRPNFRHIKLLKQMHGRGRFICVWSAGGVKWAEAVVKALHLESFVHMVTTKPMGYVDDLPVEQFMKNHIYLPDHPEVEK